MSINLAAALLLAALPTTLPVQNPDCAREAVRSINTHRSDDNFTRVKWESRNCKGTIEIRGVAKVAGDLSGFSSISSGGRVTIETESDDAKRKLVLTPSNDRFAYQYEVDGNRRAWDREGQQWLTSVVTTLVRRAGFGAEERVDYLLRERGVAGVLDEVKLLESDYTQRVYLSLLVGKTTLNGSAVRSLVDLAAHELESDYELTQVLLAVSKRYNLTSESRPAFIRATGSIESNYERRRALLAVLEKGSLSAEDVIGVLESTGEMSSDYERSQVLKQVSGAANFAEPRLQQAYLRVANDMSSDYERRQVLTALLNRGRLGAGAVDVVLAAATSFQSDYERAQVLTLVLQTQALNQAQKARMVKLIDEMRSDHERGKVASLMLKQINVN